MIRNIGVAVLFISIFCCSPKKAEQRLKDPEPAKEEQTIKKEEPDKVEPPIKEKTAIKEEQPKVVKKPNEYPDLTLTFANGLKLSTRKLTGKNVFILFQPDCDHCQEEAIYIEQRLEDFNAYTLYFISSSPMEHITAFARNFRLNGKENVKFAWTPPEAVLSHYGAIQTPSIYIYSNGRLKQSFNGQTDIESILSAL